MINQLNIKKLQDQFYKAKPFQHIVIDDFFDDETANQIVDVFPDHDDDVWTVSYNNPVENKKACSHWDKFPATIYNVLFYLCSSEFNNIIQSISRAEYVLADYGLHGGGMHSHNRGGKLNVHKDYSLHPKIPFMRNFNLIIYMTPDWEDSWGGGLEFWSHDEETQMPKECVTRISNKFNRAVLFNTTQNSWHGLPENLTCPKETARRSLAIYYLSKIDERAENRKRALYAPYKDQKNNPEILQFCKERSKS